MTDISTPVGRLVQGSPIMQPQKDMETNQPLLNPDGTPQMGVFMALAFPKVLPNGYPNAEFDALFAQLKAIAAAAWPHLFPQGAAGPSSHPRFSWKYQDGDGVDQSGKSVADKPGFRGHHILRFYTSFPVNCFHEGKFAPHEVMQNPGDIIKRGFWVRIFGEAKSNNATGQQVPGISLYPKLLSFVERGEEISSGPDAQAAFGAAPVGWRPPATNSPVPTGGVPAVAVPAVGVPVVGVPVVGVPVVPSVTPVVPVPAAVAVPIPTPQLVVSPALAAQGITVDMLKAQGWTEDAMVANGHATRV